jgi:predicted dehydrogenase
VRVFVAGLGSIGKRHLDNARALGHDADGGRLGDAAAFRPDAVVIATPTSAHPEALRWAIEHGAHAYVEKPVAATAAGIAELLDAADEAGLTVAVGYNLRFHPAIEAIRDAVVAGGIGRLLSVRAEVGSYLPDWQPERDYRDSYAAHAELGGGALLTLSHELDYVRWIAGEVETVEGRAARVSQLELDVDDVAEVITTHAGGAVASIHMDLFDRSYNRRSRWVGERGTIEWHWDGRVRLLPSGETVWDEADALAGTYEASLQDFFEAVDTGAEPRCSGRDGLRTLAVCEAVARAR